MKTLITVLLLALTFAFMGCGPGSDTGTLHIVATDAPFPFDSVSSATVTLSKIEVRNKDHSEHGDAWVTLSEETKTIDLVQLRNGVTADLLTLEIAPGIYDEIRLVVSAGTVTLKDGTVFNLNVPSGSSSGLKIKVKSPIEVVTGLSSDLLLDFDLSKSFVPQSSGSHISGFHFSPVVRAVNMTVAGTISGTVTGDQGTPAVASDDTVLEGVLVTISQDGQEIATAVTDANGKFTVIGLTAGTYTLKAELSGGSSVELGDLVVVAGNITTANVLLPTLF